MPATSARRSLNFTRQLVHFGTTTAPNTLPDADADQDGASNYLECLVGTDPLAPGDAWTIAISRTAGQVTIDFVRPANRAVEIQWRTDVSAPNSWSALDVPGNGPFFPASKTNSRIVDPLSIGASRFYRARVIEPCTPCT